MPSVVESTHDNIFHVLLLKMLQNPTFKRGHASTGGGAFQGGTSGRETEGGALNTERAHRKKVCPRATTVNVMSHSPFQDQKTTTLEGGQSQGVPQQLKPPCHAVLHACHC